MHSLPHIFIDKDIIIKKIDAAFFNKRTFLLTYFNAHCFNIYQKNETYRNILNSGTVYYDGIGMFLTAKYVLKLIPKLFNASDFNFELLNKFFDEKRKIFLIGGKFNIYFDNNISLRRKFCEYVDGDIDIKNIDSLIDKIRISNAEVVFIGLGVPMQEIVANKILNRLDEIVVICVGNFFEFYFQNIKRAPKYIRNSGLEWVHRLSHEPKRLWKRYLIGIPIFLFRIVVLKLKLTFKKNNL
jgi:N-acetylglucosaminyldiphosphoundecaprenol N-acetyl-beta-D-mannosaminyltransferase